MARVTLKTYSRQAKRVPVDDEEPAPKRRRVGDLKGGISHESDMQDGLQVLPSSDTCPSTPARESSTIIPSDPSEDAYDTPPSSPPPRQVSPNPNSRRPPLFFSRRKHVASRTTSTPSRPPLADTVANATKVAAPFKLERGKALKQMQIDLGGDIRKACKVCGMDYVPSNAEDVSLHKRFHALNVGGIDFGKAFTKDHSITKLAPVRSSGGGEVGGGSCIVVVSRKSSLANRNKAERVLQVVNTELSAVSIDDERLWGHVVSSTPILNGLVAAKDSTIAGVKGDAKMEKEERFRFYLYVEGEKCIGLCLAERIKEAYKVLSDKGEVLEPSKTLTLSTSSSISISEEPDPAILGISRIWVSVSHRRKGIGLALLDCATGDFVYGMEVPREMVAFSQPTESGGCLARSWFGGSEHWRVYLER